MLGKDSDYGTTIEIVGGNALDHVAQGAALTNKIIDRNTLLIAHSITLASAVIIVNSNIIRPAS